eukprot:TRINITY_DN12623_c0_g2_i1.p1 TRINITY_DN12623_c0_g2~~TRINITY_DN12623_c0_g2_i1.p1  ORF type:complete len:844 (+),score=327.11 TRINITY_DN12623_c0_g2_i1:15-2546(+)
MDDFDTLCEESKALVSHISEVPNVKRSFEQIGKQAQELASVPRGVDSRSHELSINKAQRLLSNQGFDAERLNQNLSTLQFASQFDVSEDISHDLEGFLSHFNETVVCTAIDQANLSVLNDCEESFARHLETDWERTKQEYMQWMGLRHVDYQHTDMDDFSAMAQVPTKRVDQEVSKSLSDIVGDFTEKKSKDSNNTENDKDMVSRFIEFAEKHNQDSSTAAHWKLIKAMLTPCHKDFLQREMQLQKGELFEDYHDSNPDLQRHLVRGSITFLQSQFAEHMRQVSRSNDRDMLVVIRAYLNERGMVDPSGCPFWPQIYYAIRCGAFDVADRLCATQPRLGAAFSDLLTQFTSCHKAAAPINAGNTLEHGAKETVLANYQQLLSGSDADRFWPFQLEVYRLLLGVDMAAAGMNPSVGATFQDFAWQKLSFVLTSSFGGSSASDGSSFSLRDFAALIREFGDSHFDPEHRQPANYFQLLLVSQQFERAIDYLARFTSPPVDAVHTALCLQYYGLLRTGALKQGDSMMPSGYLVSGGKDQDKPVLDMGALLKRFVEICGLSPSYAVRYLAMIEDYGQRIELLCELLLESHAYDVLLGPIEEQSSTSGVLAKNLSDSDVESVVELAARHARNVGQHWDAVELFLRGAHVDAVLEVFNEQLSEVMVPPNAARQFWQQKGLWFVQNFLKPEVIERLMNNPETSADIQSLGHCFQLQLNLLNFFDKVNANEHENALNILNALQLFPSGDLEPIPFSSLPECIRANFPQIALHAMTCLLRSHEQAKRAARVDVSDPHTKNYEDVGPQRRAGLQSKQQHYRKQARDLLTYVGMTDCFIPADISSRLARMEVMM